MKKGTSGMKLFTLGAAFLLLFGWVGSASAVPMSFELTNVFNPDQKGSAIFDVKDGTINLKISNTSEGTSRIIGFAFNVPDSIDGLSKFSGPSDKWAGSFWRDNINTPNKYYGLFDMGAKSSWSDGIIPGSTFDFSFALSGDKDSLPSLVANDFLTLLSNPHKGTGAPDPQYFAVIFNTSGSVGILKNVESLVETPAAHAPEPATLLLLGSGLVGLAGFRSRFKKK